MNHYPMQSALLSFLHEGMELQDKLRAELHRKQFLCETYTHTEPSRNVSYSRMEEPPEDHYRDRFVSAYELATGAFAVDDYPMSLGHAEDAPEIEGIVIDADDVVSARWLRDAYEQAKLAKTFCEGVMQEVFPAEWAMMEAEAEAQRKANKPKPAPVEFDPFHDDN